MTKNKSVCIIRNVLTGRNQKHKGATRMARTVEIKLTKEQKEQLLDLNLAYGWEIFEKPKETLLKGVEFPAKFDYFEYLGVKTPLYLVNSDKGFIELIRTNIVEIINSYVKRCDYRDNYYLSFEYYLMNLYAIYVSYSTIPYAHTLERYRYIFKGGVLLELDPLYDWFKLNLEVYKSITE